MEDSSRKSLTVQEKAYEYVKSKIIDNSFREGEFLTEGEITKALGISRTPVRGAFLRLETENLLKLSPNKGALIPSVSIREIKDVMEARIAIELFAAEKISKKYAQLAPKLRSLLEEQTQLGEKDNIHGFIELDRQFHHLTISNCDNDVLLSLYESLRDRQIRVGIQAATSSSERVKQTLAEHEDIVKCVEEDDVDGMKDATRRHLEATMTVLKEQAFA